MDSGRQLDLDDPVTYLSEPWLAPHIPTGKLALDIGANEGYFANYLLDRYEEVWAFEPHPSAARIIRDNFGERPGLKVVEAAVGDEIGTLSLQTFAYGNHQHSTGVVYDEIRPEMNIEGRGPQTGTLDVRLAKLDDLPELDGRKVDLIKMDTEGFELKILHGAEALLREQKPKLIIEVHYACDELCEPYLESLGYDWLAVLHPQRHEQPQFYWTYWLVAE